MRMSYDDQYLFTVSEDACLFIFKAVDKEGRGMKRDKEVGYAEEILITKSDLEEKVSVYEKSIKSKNLAFRIQGRRLQSLSRAVQENINYNFLMCVSVWVCWWLIGRIGSSMFFNLLQGNMQFKSPS